MRRKNPHGYRISDYRDEYLRLRFRAKDFHELARIREDDEVSYAREAENFRSFYSTEKGTLRALTTLLAAAQSSSLPEQKDLIRMALAVLGARMNKVG